MLKTKKFRPKDDITTAELAKVVEQMLLAILSAPADDDVDVPKEYITKDIERHFE